MPWSKDHTRKSARALAFRDSRVIEEGPEKRFGPSTAPRTNLSSDYVDLQPDPSPCGGFWSLSALVAEANDARSVWVTQFESVCNANAEMNGDGAVDAADLATYLDYYAKEDHRADMDRSGAIDTADFTIYSGEYAKR